MNNHARGIALEGEYDLADRGALATLFGSLRAGSPVTIDLTKVTYLDSTTLTELMKLQARFQEHPIRLLVGSGFIRRVLRIVRFEQLFEIVDAA